MYIFTYRYVFLLSTLPQIHVSQIPFHDNSAEHVHKTHSGILSNAWVQGSKIIHLSHQMDLLLLLRA